MNDDSFFSTNALCLKNFVLNELLSVGILSSYSPFTLYLPFSGRLYSIKIAFQSSALHTNQLRERYLVFSCYQQQQNIPLLHQSYQLRVIIKMTELTTGLSHGYMKNKIKRVNTDEHCVNFHLN